MTQKGEIMARANIGQKPYGASFIHIYAFYSERAGSFNQRPHVISELYYK